MTTGAFWDVTNPLKPVGQFDADEIMDIPFNFATWLTGIGSTYTSHTVICATGLECPSSSQSAGIVVARIQKDAAETLAEGERYQVTVRCVAANGESTDQSGYLKVVVK